VSGELIAERIIRACAADDLEALAAIAEIYSEEERVGAWEHMGGIRECDYGTSWLIAMMLCIPTARAAGHAVLIRDFPAPAAVIRVIRALGRGTPKRVVRRFAGSGGEDGYGLVRSLEREGLIEPIDDDLRNRGVICGLPHGERLGRVIADDPTILDEIWGIFEHAPGGLLGRREYWVDRLLELAEAGLLERDRLLDASLDAQTRDFTDRDARVMAMLHARLEPTVEERRARLDRYLRLISSRAPSSRECGLSNALGLATPDQLAGPARDVLGYAPKRVAIALLNALDVAEAAALETVVSALAHERPDVQRRGLSILERRLPELAAGADAVRACIGDVEPFAAASVRPRIAALTGGRDPSKPRVDVGLRERSRPPVEPIDVPFSPVSSVEEIVDLAAALREGQGEGIDVERLFDGLARLGASEPDGFDEMTSALRRPRSRHRHDDRSIDHALKILTAAWLDGSPPPDLAPRSAWSAELYSGDGYSTEDAVMGLLTRRAHELAHHVALGDTSPLAATPTMRDGRITTLPASPAIGPSDLEQAILRMPGHDPLTFAFRYDDDHVWNQVAIIRRDPGSFSERFTHLGLTAPDSAEYAYLRRLSEATFDHTSYASYGWRRVITATAAPGDHPATIAASLDLTDYDASPRSRGRRGVIAPDGRLGMQWAITAVPHHADLMLAHAASVIASTVEDPEGGFEDILYRACSPDVGLGTGAWYALAAAMFAKASTRRLAAGELLFAASETCRIDPPGLASAMAFFLRHDLVTLSRCVDTIATWSRTSDAAASDAYETVVAFACTLETLPHGVHGLLVLAAELRAQLRAPALAGNEAGALTRLAATTTRASASGRALAALLEPNDIAQ
jgi:Family of unknown function (DUF6493)